MQINMASLLNPTPTSFLQNKVNPVNISALSPTALHKRTCWSTAPKSQAYTSHSLVKAKVSVEGDTLVKEAASSEDNNDIGVLCLHHVGILCENLERSLDFYQRILGLKINEARPDDKLPYRGAWLWVGSEMIHLMELPNPDPLSGRPEHGGRDRHTCIAIKDVAKLKAILDKEGIPYTLSKSGRPAIFFRDPDANALELVQLE